MNHGKQADARSFRSRQPEDLAEPVVAGAGVGRRIIVPPSQTRRIERQLPLFG